MARYQVRDDKPFAFRHAMHPGETEVPNTMPRSFPFPCRERKRLLDALNHFGTPGHSVPVPREVPPLSTQLYSPPPSVM